MLTALLSMAIGPPMTAADFFPTTPGVALSYSDTAGITTSSIDEIGAPIDIGGSPATPIVTKDGPRLVNTAYYRVETGIVFLLGYDPKNLLPKPMPILEYDGKPTKWTFEGVTTTGKDGDALQVTGESKATSDQTVFGKKLPAIEVTIHALIGSSQPQEEDEQVAIYAKGIGLVQLTTKMKVGKRTQTAVRRLIKIEEAKSSD